MIYFILLLCWPVSQSKKKKKEKEISCKIDLILVYNENVYNSINNKPGVIC